LSELKDTNHNQYDIPSFGQNPYNTFVYMKKVTSGISFQTLCWLFVMFLCIYFLNASGHQYSTDEVAMIITSESLVSGKGFAVPENVGVILHKDPSPKALTGKDGRYYAKYSPLNSILLVPFTAAGDLLKAFLPAGSPDETAVFFTAGFFNSFITALTVAALAWLCSGLGLSVRTSVVTAFIFGLATTALPYAKMTFTEPPAALAITACLAGSVNYRRDGRISNILIAAVAAMLLPLARLSSILSIIPLMLYAMNRRNFWKSTVPIAAGVAAGMAVYAFLNFIRFGTVFETGYSVEGGKFNSPFLVALYAYIVSSDKSIFLYSPPLFLAISGIIIGFRKKLVPEMSCILGIVILNIGLYSRWYGWEGGLSWGPRFLVTLVPIGMAAAALYIESARKNRRRLAFVVLATALGLAVQFAATSVKYFPNYENITVKYDIESAYSEGRLFKLGAPRFLPMKAQFKDTISHYGYTISHPREYFRSGAYSYEKLRESKLVENSPDFWIFLLWTSSGWKLRIAALALFLLIAAAGTVAALRLSASLRPDINR
jgi:hypothetical protein